LRDAILEQVQLGQIRFAVNGALLTDAAAIRESAQEHIDRSLDYLWREAILIP
jgi:hypothetical protein